MTQEIEKMLDKMIESSPNNWGFVINPAAKEKYGIPNEYKGYPIGYDLLTPLDKIYFIPKP